MNALSDHAEVMELWAKATPEQKKVAIEALRECDRLMKAGASKEEMQRFMQSVVDRHHGKAVPA
jgi:hypothetical protein